MCGKNFNPDWLTQVRCSDNCDAEYDENISLGLDGYTGEKKLFCPVCNEPTTLDADGDLLLCDDCAQCKADAADHADHINRCDW